MGSLLRINALPVGQLEAGARKGAGEEPRGGPRFVAEGEEAEEAFNYNVLLLLLLLLLFGMDLWDLGLTTPA